ncbi:MAG: hypothetical protein R2830_18175 [Saprospiraceae bacterium]|nr:hypothetical protein [Saprospiraceae bacterium]
MKKQSTQRKHNFPDADLHKLCMDSIRSAHRDLALFEQYGYGLERLKQFNALCDRFKNLPDDDELLGDQMILTEKKYKAAGNLKAAIKSLMTRVAIKFNMKTGRYRKFGASKLGDMTDAQLLFCARRVLRVARQQIDFLADVGVNEQILGRISTAAQAFENAVNLQQDKVADRDIGVERRIEQGNEIYDELVVLCNVGKDIWINKDAAKYESYCLYESNNEQKKARKAALAEAG